MNFDSNTLYIDAANDRVGLGTTMPDALLTLSETAGNDIMNIYDGADEVMTMLNNGAVGFVYHS